ncbi:hypothetical protein DQM21_02550 [Levilactobacillus brevis]|nr:hypothetical protein DQM21_02550 [Levilactobacillus brevis]
MGVVIQAIKKVGTRLWITRGITLTIRWVKSYEQGETGNGTGAKIIHSYPQYLWIIKVLIAIVDEKTVTVGFVSGQNERAFCLCLVDN